MRNRWLAVFALAALTTPSIGSAQPRGSATLEARWSPGCPGSGALAAAVEERLGRPVLADADAPAHIDIDVEAVDDGTGHRAVVRISDPEGTELGRREITVDGTCAELVRPLSLIVALLIDPERVRAGAAHSEPESPSAGPPSAGPPSAPSAGAPPASAAPAAAAPLPPEVSDPPLGLRAAFGAGVAAGLQPAPTLRADVSAHLLLSIPFAVGLSLFVSPGATARAGAGELTVLAAGLALSACVPFLGPTGWSVLACVEPFVGVLSATPEGLADAEAPTEPLVGVRLGATLDRQIAGPLWGFVSVRGSVHLLRPRFYVDDGEARRVVHEPAAGGVELLGGAAVRFR